MILLMIGVLYVGLALMTGRIAKDKGLSDGGAILLSLLIGPLALAVVLLMPRRTRNS